MSFRHTNNVTSFVSKEQIQDEASIWISRIDRGLTYSENKQLTLWTQKSPSHKQALLEYAELWDDMSVLNELSNLLPLAQQIDRRRSVWSDSMRWSIAASVAFIMMITSTWVVHNTMHSSQSERIAEVNQYSTEKGKHRMVNLDDGTVVHLNTNTRIEVNYTQDTRSVSLLKGEAHFDIFHNPDRPFVVSASNKTVTAIGTAFDVEMKNGTDIQVLVTEGKIAVVQPSTPQTFMVEGETAEFEAGRIATISTVSPEQVQKVLAWQQGMIVFQGETLAYVLNEVSRYNDITFDIINEAAKQQRVAGYFKISDVNGLLKTLENNLNIEFEKVSANHYLISKS